MNSFRMTKLMSVEPHTKEKGKLLLPCRYMLQRYVLLQICGNAFHLYLQNAVRAVHKSFDDDEQLNVDEP